MFRAFRFVLALVLCISVWSTARAAPPIASVAKAIGAASSKDAAAHLSYVYKTDSLSQTSSVEAAIKRAAGVAKDLDTIRSFFTKTAAVFCGLIPGCREPIRDEIESIIIALGKPRDDQRK